MKKAFLSLIVASLIFGFVSTKELSQNSSSEDGFTIQQKQNTGA